MDNHMNVQEEIQEIVNQVPQEHQKKLRDISNDYISMMDAWPQLANAIGDVGKISVDSGPMTYAMVLMGSEILRLKDDVRKLTNLL